MKKLSAAIVLLVVVLSLITLGFTEVNEWDCPNCGRTGNTRNYCGGCGEPGPLNAGNGDLEAGLTILPAMTSVGSYITFGHYPQTEAGSDSTPIEWLVLDVDDTEQKALIISRYGLDVKPYHKEWVDITWAECTLRTWLNNEFLNNAFSPSEQKAILTTEVDNGKRQGYNEWDTRGGNNTQDRIFLLSYAEGNKYLGITYGYGNYINSMVAPTAYAIKQGAVFNDNFKTTDDMMAGRWWLRSPGSEQFTAALVITDGSLLDDDVSCDYDVVRPALWINLQSGIF